MTSCLLWFQSESAQSQALNAQLDQKLMKVKSLLMEVLARQVATHLIDVTRSIARLQDVATSGKRSIGQDKKMTTKSTPFHATLNILELEDREKTFEEAKTDLVTCSDQISRAAQQVALVSANKKLSETVGHLNIQV